MMEKGWEFLRKVILVMIFIDVHELYFEMYDSVPRKGLREEMRRLRIRKGYTGSTRYIYKG